MTADNAEGEGVQLFEPNDGDALAAEPQRGSMYGTGSRHFVGENPPRGARSTTR